MKCGLGVRETFPRPDASPPRCAQLMGLASRGCLVLVLGATAERRNLFFRSDLGLPWIRTFSLRPADPGKTVNEAGRAFNGPRADHHPVLCAHCRPDRQHRRRYRPTSTSRSTHVWPPFTWTTIPDTQGSATPKTWASVGTPGAVQVQCYTRRSAASRHPLRWRGAATNT